MYLKLLLIGACIGAGAEISTAIVSLTFKIIKKWKRNS